MDSFKLTQIVVALVIRVRASRSLSFTPLFSTRTSCWRNTVSMRMRQYSSLFRIICVSLMGSLRPTPSLRRRRHLTTMPRGFYICITLSTSDIDWQLACVFDLHLCVRSLCCVPLRRSLPQTSARMLLRHLVGYTSRDRSVSSVFHLETYDTS
jgi:hypothetical protein